MGGCAIALERREKTMSSTPARTKPSSMRTVSVKVPAETVPVEIALTKLFAAARGNLQQLQLRLPKTKYPLEARLVQRDGALYVVLAVPGARVDDLVAQPLTLTGTLIAHNNGLFYVLTSKGVNVPLKAERYGKALRLLAGHRVRLRGHYEDGYFDVAEAKIVEEDADDDDQQR